MSDLQAQMDFTNTGILYLNSADTLYINGSFQNTNGSVLSNNGNLHVTANLWNAQSFPTPSMGTLFLCGNTLQTVSGTSSYATFNLVTNNPAGFTLNQNLRVEGTHNFVNGVITTSSSPSYLVYESRAGYNGDGDHAHVNGWVKKIGSTNFTFPVGNGSATRKAAIENLSSSLEFDVRYDAATRNAMNIQQPGLIVDPNEYWTINEVTGVGSAQVHLNWDNNRVDVPPYLVSAIRVGYFTGGFWTEVGGSAIGDITGTGEITSPMLPSFGNFTFVSTGLVLPMQFLSINAHRRSSYNIVKWEASTVRDVYHFEIERSDDGLLFQKIGTTVSYNSTSTGSYSYKDFASQKGVVWYRIRGVMKDGKSMLSAMVAIKDRKETSRFMYVLNNPASGWIQLFAPESFEGRCQYSIISTKGQLVQTGTFIIKEPGNISIALLRGITQGIYVLSVFNARQRFQQRVLIR